MVGTWNAVRTSAALGAGALLLSACAESGAEGGDAWPESNVEIIAGFGAGGTPDLLARGVGEQLEDAHGINVTVANRTGGASTIALNEALTAEADGTTVALATSNGLLWQPLVEEGLEYGQTDGYEALVKVAESAFSLMVAADGDIGDIDDFIQRAEAGEELSVAVTGEGAQTDLTVQLLNEQNGWNLRSVPYTDGAGEGILAVIRGEVDAQISTTAGVQGQIDAGDVEILAILGDENEPNNPDVPTLEDLDLESPANTFYLVISDETDPELRDEIVESLEAIIESEEWESAVGDIGLPYDVLGYDDTQEEIANLIEQFDVLAP